jgi:hypothetical protein
MPTPDVVPWADALPPPGTFGATCETHQDCESRLCVETELGPVCTRVCVEGECPASWVCRLVLIAPPDAISVCLPDREQVCATGECEADAVELEPCGNCGTRRRTCGDDCRWGVWSNCSGEGVCPAGVEEVQGCGECATQRRVCTAECRWSPWGACEGGGECEAGDLDTEDCGWCGERTRSCTAQCVWSGWSSCDAQGQCEAGAVRATPCGDCGQQTAVCGADCQWGAPGPCVGEGVCTSGARQEEPCGNCGTRSRQCTAACAWTEWSSCTSQGACQPGAQETVPCGNCGRATRTCTASCAWGPPGTCTGQGPCGPGDQEPCENCGTRTCRSDCTWGTCAIGAVDAFEDNDSKATARALTGITDDDDAAAFLTANINPSYDEDWYKVVVADTLGAVINPWARLGQVPVGQSYQLCVEYACSASPPGTPPPRQCVTVNGGATQTIELDPSGCDDECGWLCTDNGGTLYMQVKPVTTGSCADYRLDYGA